MKTAYHRDAGGLAFKSGMKVVGISDHTVALYDPKGIDIAAADRHVARHGVLRGQLDNQLKPFVDLELNKDYSHCNAHQLREQLHAQKTKF